MKWGVRLQPVSNSVQNRVHTGREWVVTMVCACWHCCWCFAEARPNVTPIIEKNSEAKIKHATEGYHKIWCGHGVSSRSDWKNVAECYDK